MVTPCMVARDGQSIICCSWVLCPPREQVIGAFVIINVMKLVTTRKLGHANPVAICAPIGEGHSSGLQFMKSP